MAVEMWGYKTSLGGLLPIYKVPYTKAQLKTQGSASTLNRLVWQYNNPADTGYFSLLPGSMLDDFRAIFKEGCGGGNAGAYLGNMAGTHRFINQDGTFDNVYRIDVTPGTLTYADLGGIVEEVRNTGSFNDYVSGQWVLFGSSNYVVGTRPAPTMGFQTSSVSTPYIPWMHVMTSDGYIQQLDFFVDKNAYGWMYLVFETPGDPPFGGTSLPPNFQMEYIKTIGDGSEEDPVARYNPRIGTSTVGAYKMNKSGVLEFLGNLWTTTTIESIRQVFIGDASNAILGLQWFYGLADKVGTTALQAKVRVGNVTFSDVQSFPVVNTEFVEYDFGTIAVPAMHGNHLDYTACAYKMYLPFIGIIDLNPADIIGKTLYLKYIINMTDGSAVCQLSTTATSPDGQGLVFSTSCQWGYDIPVKVDPGRSVALATLRTLTAGTLFQGDTPSYSAGGLNANTSVMGDFQAKLVVYKQDDLTQDLSNAQGLPSGQSLLLSQASGYVKAPVIYNAATLPARRVGEIAALLAEGIYI